MIASSLASPSISRSRLAIAIVAAALMSAGVVTVTRAGTAQEDPAPQLAVSYDDLDLSTEKGALALYRRISSAARDVCPQSSKYSARVTQLSRDCIATAIARAVREVNSEQLAKVDAARSPRRPTEG